MLASGGPVHYVGLPLKDQQQAIMSLSEHMEFEVFENPLHAARERGRGTFPNWKDNYYLVLM